MKKGLLTAPNVVTLFRLALVPVFVWFYLRGKPDSALWCFAVAMASDGIDGLLARVLDQRSALGAFLDPLADKILVGAALVLLLADGVAPLWLVVLIFWRDGMMIAGTLWVRRKHLALPQMPSRVGKYATFTLAVFVVLGLYEQTGYAANHSSAYLWALGYISGLCVVISTLQYFARFGYLIFAPARKA